MDASAGIDFYRAIAPFARFDGVVDAANYHPLPDDWVIGVCDVVDSTGASAAGRYKAVNMVGAGVISAVRNALGGVNFPFVFGGDGASFALPAGMAGLAADAMAAVQAWAREETGLELRAAVVPMAAIRAAGHDVLVGRYAASPHVAYAMFSGGGVAWAEREMKAGRFAVHPAPSGTRPDLQGLSCRWSPMRSARGVILSVLVVPEGESGPAFRELVSRVLALAREEGAEGSPMREGGFRMRPFPPPPASNIPVPVGADRKPRPAWQLWLFGLFASLVFRFGLRLGRFDARHYDATLRANSDFRKFDDGLKLTLDCGEAFADRLERLLEEARQAGVCRYGLHRQSDAIMTCIVPSFTSDDHFHFIDGASGGYAAAALGLKGRTGGAPPEPL